MDRIVVYKGRVTSITIKLPYDVSNDVITSEIRTEKSRTSTFLGSWDISFLTDGTDGELVLTFDDSDSTLGTKSVGYMDLKRVSGGKPLSVFDDPVEVLFKEPITV